jgi:hypothetical protein
MEENRMMPKASLKFVRDIPPIRGAGGGPRRSTMLLRWKATLTGANLGWIVFENENTFTPVHRVLGDPEIGPVVLIGPNIFEVDLEQTDFFRTEHEARDAYWAAREGRS